MCTPGPLNVALKSGTPISETLRLPATMPSMRARTVPRPIRFLSEDSETSSRPSWRSSLSRIWTTSSKRGIGDKYDQGSREEEARIASCIKQLNHWSATVVLLIIVQVISDYLHHKFQRVPTASELCAILLLLYPLASVTAVCFFARVRPYAAYLMGFGSLLMTCHVTWHWDRHLAEFKESILVDQPFLRDMSACSSTAAASGLADPSIYRSLYGLAFGSSGLAFLDTAMLFVVMFQNCVQSSFLPRTGITVTAVVSVGQGLVFIFWPFLSQDMYPSWLCRLLATSVWTAHLIHSSYVFWSTVKQGIRLSEELHQALELDLKNQTDGQQADTVLNHILKNSMADAIGCIEMFCQRIKKINPGADVAILTKASDILFRGMWWCKLREAMLSMVAGRYETVKTATSLHQFGQDFIRGRNLALGCIPVCVEMDSTACNVVLENAVTNAIRHGCLHDPKVKLAVEVYDQSMEGFEAWREKSPLTAGDVQGDAQGRPVVVRFLLSNQANSNRPPLHTAWSSQGRSDALAHDSSRPTLSSGLGLQHISMVVKCCGMVARLWQQECQVFFELCFNTRVTRVTASGQEVVKVMRPIPVGLQIICLDDSAIARQSLQHMLSAEIPGATVTTYGKYVAEVAEFKKAALNQGHVLILDQHVDFPEANLLGTDIVKELLAAGYKGFACIRSGNAAEADRALSRQSGAHWHVGKEVRLRDMVNELMSEYDSFLQRQGVRSNLRSASLQCLEVVSASSGVVVEAGGSSSVSVSEC